jgi:type IV secretory pathway VirB3-like protein
MAGEATNIFTIPTGPQNIFGLGVDMLTFGFGFTTIVDIAVVTAGQDPV